MDPSNAVLAALSSDDSNLLRPHLKKSILEQKDVLFEIGDRIHAVYFPDGAVISLVITLSTGEIIEAAMVGKDGVLGAVAALDGKLALSRAIVQLGGACHTCDSEILRRAALQSPTLLAALLHHEQSVFFQAQQSTACMAAHPVQARLCRWLLRARDLSGSDSLHFTQEFLAEMLGVRRTSVTVVAMTLQQAGIIKYSRGNIEILNSDALREASCECYGAIRDFNRRLTGMP